jgi:hypothetical protein
MGIRSQQTEPGCREIVSIQQVTEVHRFKRTAMSNESIFHADPLKFADQVCDKPDLSHRRIDPGMVAKSQLPW